MNIFTQAISQLKATAKNAIDAAVGSVVQAAISTEVVQEEIRDTVEQKVKGFLYVAIPVAAAVVFIIFFVRSKGKK